MRRKTKSVNYVAEVTVSLWRRVQEGGVILLAALAIFLFIALCTYHEADPGWSRTGKDLVIHNIAGSSGAWFSDLFLFLFGFTAYMFPAMLAYAGFCFFQNRLQTGIFNRFLWLLRALGFLAAVVSASGLAEIQFGMFDTGRSYSAGGIIGEVMIAHLIPVFGPFGSNLFLMALFLVGITLATGLSWFGVMDVVSTGFIMHLRLLPSRLQKIYQSSINIYQNIFLKLGRLILYPFGLCSKSSASDVEKNTSNNKGLLSANKKLKKRPGQLLALPEEKALIVKKKEDDWEQDEEKYGMGNEKGASDKEKDASFSFFKQKNNKANNTDTHFNIYPYPPSENADMILPAVHLLQKAMEGDQPASFSNQKLSQLRKEVEARLLEFGVQVNVVQVLPGPVITLFELELAAGIKISRITGLAKDLARALSVSRVRVVEVIPGKSVVGLEIPNEHRELVRLRSIVESPQYQKSSSLLSLALGKDISGIPVVVDLAKMPHLLVAGTTGSGKSVGVNAMLLSLLYKATSDEVRLILIDPKMLELSVYDGIPHLLTPVVTDMKDAANVLRWCVGEMERRYQLMSAMGVRNLLGFNSKIKEAEANGAKLENPLWQKEMGEETKYLNRLPYIVVIIDEFADMIMVVGKKVEELIARIAQKARAAGIHMILATQRPSVDVITGLIKANVPTRIAFQVSSRIDSRTILDQQGAEQLLGHGDMLYLAPGTGIPIRVHGAFVSDEEVHAVVKALKQTAKPDYAEDILAGASFSSSKFGFNDEDEDGEQDEMYDQAVQIVLESRRASISHLQRRLKIGYNRAARLIETMEAAGLVTAMQSNGTREVLSKDA